MALRAQVSPRAAALHARYGRWMRARSCSPALTYGFARKATLEDTGVNMGFVFQDGALLPELTNEENAAMPLLLAGMSLPSALPMPASGWCVWAWRMRLDVAPDRFRWPSPAGGDCPRYGGWPRRRLCG